MDGKRSQELDCDSIERFTGRVGNYRKYRPEYPRALFDYLETEIGLEASWVIADIGAGTGISAKPFLKRGNRVFAVEPNAAMRNASVDVLSRYHEFTAVDGTAECTGLPRQSIDLVFAGQAFHWFCNSDAVEEINRILKPSGYLCIVWNERELASDEFLRDYESLITTFAGDYEKIRHDKFTLSDIENAFSRKFSSVVFDHSQSLDRDGFKGRILSSSYMPDEASDRYRPMLKIVYSLFAKYQENGRISVSYKTKLYFTKF